MPVKTASQTLPGFTKYQALSSTDSSPRAGSFSSDSLARGGNSSNTSYASSVHGSGHEGTTSPENGPFTSYRVSHAPVQPSQYYSHHSSHNLGYAAVSSASMNHSQAYMDVHPSHVPSNHGHAQYAPPSISTTIPATIHR